MNYDFIKNSMRKEVEKTLGLSKMIIEERFKYKDSICKYTGYIKCLDTNELILIQNTKNIANNLETNIIMEMDLEDISVSIIEKFHNCKDNINVKELFEKEFYKDLDIYTAGKGGRTLVNIFENNNYYKHIFVDLEGAYIFEYKYDGKDIHKECNRMKIEDIRVIVEKGDLL